MTMSTLCGLMGVQGLRGRVLRCTDAPSTHLGILSRLAHGYGTGTTPLSSRMVGAPDWTGQGDNMSLLPTIGKSREVITAEIAEKKAKHDRLPAHWVDRRLAIMDEIDDLVDDWIAAGA